MHINFFLTFLKCFIATRQNQTKAMLFKMVCDCIDMFLLYGKHTGNCFLLFGKNMGNCFWSYGAEL
jgi:hypothetical protein